MTLKSVPLAVIGDTAPLNVNGDNSASIHVRGGSVAASGMTLVFEGSVDSTDGTDGSWFSIYGARTNANTAESSVTNYSLGVGASGQAWRLNVNNYSFIRVRLSARTAGDIVVNMRSDSAVLEPTPVSSAHGVSVIGAQGSQIQVVSTASTNLSTPVASATNITELTVSNPTASPAFVKLYNKASSPTLASDIPVLTIPVAAGAFVSMEFGPVGKRLTTGLALAITGAIANTDTTNAPAGVTVHATRI